VCVNRCAAQRQERQGRLTTTYGIYSGEDVGDEGVPDGRREEEEEEATDLDDSDECAVSDGYHDEIAKDSVG
jgi:hypothetical protein